MSQYSFFLKVMQNAARKAESRIIRDFMELSGLQITMKNDREFVTSADRRSEEIIYNEISKKIQGNNCAFLMEESGYVGASNAEFCFIVDPLDGTFNFMRGASYFCISIALQHNIGASKKIVAAIIHSPITRETFYAEAAAGATYVDPNSMEHKMKTSNKKRFVDSIIATSMSHSDIGHHKFINKLAKNNAHIRSTGSTALDLAYLASGRYEAALYPQTRMWDYAAGYLLITEAGGNIRNYLGGDDVSDGENGLAACNSAQFYKLLSNMRRDIGNK